VADEGVERLTDHLLRVARETRVERLERRLAIELDGSLAHVDGQIGDALQLRSDLHGRGHEAEVDRGRLHHRDQLDRVLVDRQLHLIDVAVGVDHPLGHSRVALQQRADRLLDLILHHRSHPQEELFQTFDVSVEVAHVNSRYEV
jgi:hypothetical protein